jgi:membrane protein DedA with SNARE-associated domain
MPVLLSLALGTLASEDLACIAAGLLIARGDLSFGPAVAACLAGIFAGDLLLFGAGRVLGRRALRFRLVRRFITESQVEHASAWLRRRGLVVALISRFAPGLRLPTYFAAGVLKTGALKFSGYLLIAASLWTPLLVGASAVAGERARNFPYAALIPVMLAAWRLSLGLADWRTRRRWLGFWKRKLAWEFWPPYISYLPVAAWIACLAVKHRSLAVFTAANPGIPAGGFVGESKSEILAGLENAARFRLVGSPAEAMQFLAEERLEYPVVLKPDAGERGRDVEVVRTASELVRYFDRHRGPVIVQEYVAGVEYGVFYVRYPGEAQGRIFSITEKRFPAVTGDGRSTLEDLILRDGRAVCLAGAYIKVSKLQPDAVPEAGRKVQLVELGSHCRGAIFLDGGRLRTPQLEAAIDRISRGFRGFYFGRYDVRAASADEFRAGLFRVLELNGVSSEATHIYDPGVSLLGAYRVLFEQWRMAFEIGAENRALGFRPAGVSDLLRLTWNRFQSKERKLAARQPQHGGRAEQHGNRQGEQFPAIVHGG